MKKTLVFLVVIAMLLPLGWTESMGEAAWQEETTSAKSGGSISEGVKLAAQDGQAIADVSDNNAQMNLLYPDDINPPETCHVPRMAPLGQDLEMMLGPWVGPNSLLALDQPPNWNGAANLTGVTASTNLDVIALNTEGLVAVWSDLGGKIKYSTWGASNGWTSPVQLGTQSASGKPVLISRGPTHFAVFARFNYSIQVREWYMSDGMGNTWVNIGIDDAISDPVVISQDAGHMAIFYKSTGGAVKFTEWEGAWLKQPVSLGQPAAGSASYPIDSELAAVSRNGDHSAVFGVDAIGQLWYRERTIRNELDWSDTTWVKLLEGVEIARPAVASRHANHIGIVVKDSSGQPYYTRWSWQVPQKLYLPLVGRPSAGTALVALEGGTDQVSAWEFFGPPGWSQPVALEAATFTSPLTLVPRGLDSMVLLGIKSDGNLYEAVWTEDTNWGSWQAIAGPGMNVSQTLAVVGRRMNDIMVLGRYATTDQVWYKHYTSLDKPLTQQDLGFSLEGLPRAQTLAFVDGKWIWVSLTRQTMGTWQVEGREISTGISASLDLEHANSGQAANRGAVAAADLDIDGNSEVVVATLRSNLSDIDLSVLELSYQDPATLVISASTLYTWPDPQGGADVNLAIGDLNGDGFRNEVVVGYSSSSAMHFGVFLYGEYGLDPQGASTTINYPDWCAGLGNCTSSGKHDLEMTIGRIKNEIARPYDREQLVVLDVTDISLSGLTYAQDWVVTRHLITDTWALDPVGACHLQDPNTNPGNASSIAGDPYTAGLGTGDMDADGLANIVYSFGDKLAVVTNTDSCTYKQISGMPDRERSLAMGDLDIDARNEVVVGYRGASTTVDLFEIAEAQSLRLSAQDVINGGYTVLAADTDNDTRLAELAGCKTFAEVHVVGVVNGAPRWYGADSLPIQESGGVYGRTETGGGGTSDGTTETYGGSFSLGFEVEVNIPIAAVKAGEVRGQVTQEFMWSSGTTYSTVWSQTQEMGYEYAAASRGMVVYNSTEFTCFYYNVYPPAEPEAKTRAMLCKPTGRIKAEDFKALEDWHDINFKQSAGPSWVDVGHRSPRGVHTNNLEEPDNYRSVLPVDISRVKYIWNMFSPIKVSYASQGGFTNYWHISDMAGGETATDTSFEENTSLSMGLTAWYITVDLAGTYGIGSTESNVISWESTLEMGGAVEKFQDITRLCYDIVPYVYAARAQTAAGVVYPYLEMDYYVPGIYNCARAEMSNFVDDLLRLPVP